MRECLDESTLEPQFKITSIADLVRIRREEASELEKENANRRSLYENVTPSTSTHATFDRKRESPTPPFTDRDNIKKQKASDSGTFASPIKPIIRPRKPSSVRRDGL